MVLPLALVCCFSAKMWDVMLYTKPVETVTERYVMTNLLPLT